MRTTEERVQSVVMETFHLSSNEVADKLSFKDIQVWDSLGHLNLVMALQLEFCVEFDIEEVMAMENVAKIKDIVRTKLESLQV